MLGIIITIPRNEAGKFKENANAKYRELLKLINGKLSQILQREQNRKHEKRKSKNKGKYQIISGESIKFAAKLEKKDAQYCFIQDLCAKDDPNPSFANRVVSPLCLSVYAVTKNAFLPFSECGDVIISQFYHNELMETSNDSNRNKHSR